MKRFLTLVGLALCTAAVLVGFAWPDLALATEAAFPAAAEGSPAWVLVLMGVLNGAYLLTGQLEALKGYRTFVFIGADLVAGATAAWLHAGGGTVERLVAVLTVLVSGIPGILGAIRATRALN